MPAHGTAADWAALNSSGFVNLPTGADTEGYAHLKVPDDYSADGALIAWFFMYGGADAGDAVMNFTSAFAANGEDYNNNAEGDPANVLDTWGNDALRSFACSMSLNGLATGDLISVLCQREGTAVADTIAEDIAFMGFEFVYTADS